MKGVGKKRVIWLKLHFLRYLTGGFSMIVGLFSHRPFIKILFCRFTISISRFRITTHFTENFPKISQKFLGKFLLPHLPPLPTPHPTHPHPPPTSPNTPRTSNSIFSKIYFFLNWPSLSHDVHLSNVQWSFLKKWTVLSEPHGGELH